MIMAVSYDAPLTTTSPGVASEKHRFLHGPGTDQILATEDMGISVNTGRWLLSDHQGTVRDVVEYDSATDATVLDHHRTYDTFGDVTEYNSSGTSRAFISSVPFAYAGRPYAAGGTGS